LRVKTNLDAKATILSFELEFIFVAKVILHKNILNMSTLVSGILLGLS